MKHFYFSLLISILFLGGSRSGFAQISLDSCQAKAIRNYPLIRQLGLIDQTNEFTVSNANKAFLPQLSFNVIGGVIDGLPGFNTPGSTGNEASDLQLISVVQLNQAIWDGGKTRASKELAKANTAVEKADVEVALYQIRERVDNLFFGILLIEAQIAQNKIYLSNLERNSTRIEVAIENGIAYRSDLDEIKVELLNAEERILELEHNRAAYTMMLSVMIGMPLAEDEELIRPKQEFSDFSGIVNRPELSVFDSQKELIDARSLMNRSNLYPKIGLLGFGTFLAPGIDFGSSEINRVLVAGLSVSWDIAGLYRNGNNKKLEEISMMRIANQRETFLFNTNLQIGQTEMELKKYQQLIEKGREVVAVQQRIKKAYEVKYDNGACTMTELLDKTNEENLASQKLIQQEIRYLQKVYQYKYKSGN